MGLLKFVNSPVGQSVMLLLVFSFFISCSDSQKDSKLRIYCSPVSMVPIELLNEAHRHLYPEQTVNLKEQQHAGKMLQSLWEKEIDMMVCTGLPDSIVVSQLISEGYWVDTFAYTSIKPSFPMDQFVPVPEIDSLFPLVAIGSPNKTNHHFRSFILSDKGQWICFKTVLSPVIN